MKNEVLKKILRRAILPLIILTFLSSSTAGLAESSVKGDVSTQLSSQQVIAKDTAHQKTIAVGKTDATLSKQVLSQKSSPGTVFSGIKSLISRFENLATKTINTVKTAILPKSGVKTQLSVTKTAPQTSVKPSSRPLPQTPVVKKETVKPTETEKQLPVISPKVATLPIEEPTSNVAETIA
ncbi:MAG: hypothetical protein JNJ47_02205, partial [Alphaproteobacteria bacterium]|nr:hypothetical protein [Alphaproteobacteria bacterium]